MMVFFRTDASFKIGSGHVMRCITLANIIRSDKNTCIFICRDLEGNLNDIIRANGFEIRVLPKPTRCMENSDFFGRSLYETWLEVPWEDDLLDLKAAVGNSHVDILVVDHYGLDARYEMMAREFSNSIGIIDDLADRPHDCDWLLDQNLGRTIQTYSNLTQNRTHLLLGPHFGLLRPEFARLRKKNLQFRKSNILNNILITMGGMDLENITGKILESISKIQDSRIKFTVVLGHNNPWATEISHLASTIDSVVAVIQGTNRMAELMTNCDLSIGAAGSTSWERCCLGLPSFVFEIAKNQYTIAKCLEESGAAIIIDRNNLDHLGVLINHFSDNPGQLREMSQKASQICDGLGAERAWFEIQQAHQCK